MDRDIQRHDPVQRMSLVCIAVVLGFTSLRVGAEIFAPLLLALVTGVIVAPVMGFLERARFPRSLAALTIVLFGVLGISALAFLAEPLIWQIADELPRLRWEIRSWVEEFRGFIRGLDEVNKQVEQALGTSIAGGTDEPASPVPNLSDALFLAPQLFAQSLIFLGTFFFFLLTRQGIYEWVSAQFGEGGDAEVIKQRFKNAEHLVSRYFLTISAINLVLGAALAGFLAIIGLPGALVWGVVAAV